jgi:hypothetical protein
MPGEDNDKDTKAISLDEQLQRIRDAWRAEHAKPYSPLAANEIDGWVREVRLRLNTSQRGP